MTLPDPADIATATWGGKRTPGPGKKQGAPAKDKSKKAACITITLSCEAAVADLKKKAIAAHKTPGALIEVKLKLSKKAR